MEAQVLNKQRIRELSDEGAARMAGIEVLKMRIFASKMNTNIFSIVLKYNINIIFVEEDAI